MSTVGLNTLTGVGLTQNQPYTSSWRDASSANRQLQHHTDIFRVEVPLQAPFIAEHRLQFQAPDKYANRVKNMVVVGTTGNTPMAFETHHTVEQINMLSGTIYRGLQNDSAYREEVVVAQEVEQHMPAVIKACEAYHSHSKDGWITSAGFVVCARKAGLNLTRTQFLALERSVPKDRMGRINFYQLQDTVTLLASGQGPASPDSTTRRFQ